MGKRGLVLIAPLAGISMAVLGQFSQQPPTANPAGGEHYGRGINAGGAISSLSPRAPASGPAAYAAAPAAAASPAVEGGASGPGPAPEVLDPTNLTVTKFWNGVNWIVNLLWNAGNGPFTVSYSPDPSFQSGVKTLEKGTNATSRSVTADPGKTLEAFDVAGQTPLSSAAQGMGYDPEPFPTVSAVSGTSLWWGNPVTLTGTYMDPIPKSNTAYMMDLPVRATSTTVLGNYATSATFTIPDDARGFWGLVQSHGRSSAYGGSSYVPLTAPGVGPFTAIYGIAYVPSNGRFWLAADGTVQQRDLFRQAPGSACAPAACPSITGLVKPYISRVTSEASPRFLYVDGTLGVTTVHQVDAVTGADTPYASTHDTSFTRNIRPVGIAVDPDGSACYIADASGNKVVKIPAGAGSGSTIVDTWGGRTFSFPDPCGIDVNLGHQIAVAHTNGTIYYIYGQSLWTTYGYAGGLVHSVHFDKDYATASNPFLFYSNELAMAEAFNRNAIGSNPARFHGGIVFGLSSGYISLEPDWFFYVYRHFPQRVVLNNSGQSTAYPTGYQTADRVIQMQCTGWAGRKVRLRVIDPPDLSAYAPDAGWPRPTPDPNPPALPYEGNDNKGTLDYGVGLLADGSDALVSNTYTLGGDGTLTFYLKVPARYSGDNFQVEVTKCNYAGTVLPERVAALSSVYTSWKRVFVEKDKMFRRGGILDPDKGSFPSNYALPDNQIALDLTNQNLYCASGTPPCPCTSLPCPSANIPITVFDAAHPYGSGTDQSRTITLLESYTLDGKPVLRATLDASLNRMGATPAAPLYIAGFTNPATQKCAGVGSVSGCDPDPNQINASNSCFYDADMRDIEQPCDDGYVEFIGQRSGAGAVPYLPKSWFDAATVNGFAYFSQIWFQHFQPAADTPPHADVPHNYFHLMGATAFSIKAGTSNAIYDWSYLFQQAIEQTSYTPEQKRYYSQAVTSHEVVGHQFDTNFCSNLTCGSITGLGQHDDRPWWNASTTGCPNANPCLMDPDAGIATDAVNRFCVEDLLLGDPNAASPCMDTLGNIYQRPDTSIRTGKDPK